MHACMDICMHVFLYTCMYICPTVCLFVCQCGCVHARAYVVMEFACGTRIDVRTITHKCIAGVQLRG